MRVTLSSSPSHARLTTVCCVFTETCLPVVQVRNASWHILHVSRSVQRVLLCARLAPVRSCATLRSGESGSQLSLSAGGFTAHI